MPLRANSEANPYSAAERWLITIPVLSASLLHAVNMTTAYVALPSIQGNLSATPDQVSWVITSFVVASAIGTILTSWIAARVGRRALFLASIIGFTVTALLCASADSLGELVIYRAIQGFISAPLLPLSQSVMLDTWPKERHGFAMGIWSLGMIMGPVMGPTLGALLTEWYGWRYLFFMNVPLGFIAFASMAWVLPRTPGNRARLDWIGVVALTMAVASVQLMLDRGQGQDWFESTEIQLEAALAVLSTWVFVVHCLTGKSPYLDLRIFRDRNFVVGIGLIFVFGICAFSTMLVLPLFLQSVQAYPVLTSGWILSARGIGTMTAMLAGGLLADRFPMRWLVLFGLLCIAGSNAWMTHWTAEVGVHEVVSTTILSGFGMGMMWVALTTVTFSTLPPVFRVEGAAIFALIRAIGASMGTSIAVGVIVYSSQFNYIELRDHVSLYNDVLNAAPELAADTTAGLARLYRMVENEARVIGFLNAYLFLTVVSLAAVPLTFALRSPRRTRT